MRVFCVGLLAMAAYAAEIAPGTHVLAVFENSITSASARPGDRVWMRTAYTIPTNAEPLPAGSSFRGSVVRARRSGRLAGNAELEIVLDSLVLPNGRIIPLPSLRWTRKQAGDAIGAGTHVAGRLLLGNLAGTLAGLGFAAATNSEVPYSVGSIAGTGLGFGLSLIERGREIVMDAGSTADITFDVAVAVP